MLFGPFISLKLPLALFASFLVVAPVGAQTVKSLWINGEILSFTTAQPSAASIPCMQAENDNQWTITLGTLQGQATYTLLVSAMANGQSIEVEPAGDCGDVAGVARAKKVKIVATP